MTVADCATAKSHTSPVNGSTRTFSSDANTARTVSSRSSSVNRVFLWCAAATATMTLEKSLALRRIRSW